VRVQRAEERATEALTKAEQAQQQLAEQEAAAKPKLHFSQKVITPLSVNGTGEKVIEVSISTDRAIAGAIIGIVCSGPVEDLKDARLEGAGVSPLSYARLEGNSIGVPRANIVAVAVQIPAAFLPGQELIAEVRSKEDVSVVGVTNVQFRPQN
jgi:hypothetical protein